MFLISTTPSLIPSAEFGKMENVWNVLKELLRLMEFALKLTHSVMLLMLKETVLLVSLDILLKMDFVS